MFLVGCRGADKKDIFTLKLDSSVLEYMKYCKDPGRNRKLSKTEFIIFILASSPFKIKAKTKLPIERETIRSMETS